MPKFYSDLLDEDLVYERCESFGGGMDSFTRSTLLAPDQFQYSENMVIPNNLEARMRPGADNMATNLVQKIQGLVYNDPPAGASIILWCAGRMWAAGFAGSAGAGKEDDAVCVSRLLSYGNGDWDIVDRSFRVGKGEGDPVIGLCRIPASVPEQEILGI